MGNFFYSIFLFSYKLFLVLTSPFVEKAKLMLTGRKNWRAAIKQKFQENKEPVVWFHAASLGEFEQARPLIELFNRNFPQYKILISFFSPSGYEIRKNYQPSFYICYLPFDSRKNASSFLNTVNPSLVFFVKYEFWYYYSSEIKKRKLPMLSFSAIFRKSQIYFQWYGGFNRKILNNFTYFFVQNQESADLLNSIGIKNVELAGDTRFDRVLEIASQRKEIQQIDRFKKNKKLFVCGSIWESDLEVINELIARLKESYTFILAPHDISLQNLNAIKEKLNYPCNTHSDLENEDGNFILLLNTMGMLASVYGYAEAAYIGGAFGKGLHNILEASVYKIPVFFGNRNYKKFNEAVELANLGAAFPVSGGNEIADRLNGLEGKEESLEVIIRQYFESKRGATERIFNFSKKLLEA